MNDVTTSNVLASQFKASLRMLKAVIAVMPDGLWDSPDHDNRSWRLAYHTLWAARFYLSVSPRTFVYWDKAIKGAESLGGWWEDPKDKIVVQGKNSQAELTEYLDSIIGILPIAIAEVPFDASSGFEWYPFSKLELHFMNIRHIQHHTAQLIERLRIAGITGIEWISNGDQENQWPG